MEGRMEIGGRKKKGGERIEGGEVNGNHEQSIYIY